MIEPKNVTFPITLETFTALQKAELGRDLDPSEIEQTARDVKGSQHWAALCRGWVLLAFRRGLELLASAGTLPS